MARVVLDDGGGRMFEKSVTLARAATSGVVIIITLSAAVLSEDRKNSGIRVSFSFAFVNLHHDKPLPVSHTDDGVEREKGRNQGKYFILSQCH